MCKVFNSEFTDDSVSQSILSLQALIQLRPEDATEIKKICQETFNDTDEQEQEINVNINIEDQWYSETPRTIKGASPFTKVYLELESTTKHGESGNINLLHNKEFIGFLQANFMPYIFIWAGFVYRYIQDVNITRLSQGVIEKCFATKRRAIPKPIVPARHIHASLKDALADCAVNQLEETIKEEDTTNSKGKSSIFRNMI